MHTLLEISVLERCEAYKHIQQYLTEKLKNVLSHF